MNPVLHKELSYALASDATTVHLTMEMFKRRTDTRSVHIPYEEEAPALNDLMGGQLGTVGQAGVKDFDPAVWYGVFVPAKTPASVVERSNREFVQILKLPATEAWLREQGLEPIADTPAAERNRTAGEVRNWKKVIQASNIKAD